MRRTKEDRWELAGQIWGVVGTLFDAALSILLVVAIVYVIYQGGIKCYDYGYRIFTETPISAGAGKEVTVTIPMDFSAKELGTLFEDSGLSRDKWLCVLQYYCSEYREYVKGGTYTLSTAMTTEQMFGIIADINIAKEEARAEQDDLLSLDEEPEVIISDDDTGEYTEKGADDDNVQEIDKNSDIEDLLGNDIR